jgi:hypothetical protein
VPERLGQRHHVAAGLLADLGHGVDEGDLGGQERVRRHLDQLGRLQVHDQQRAARLERPPVDLAQPRLGPARSAASGAVRGDAEHDAVGRQAVLHGEALPQELGVPGQVDRGAGWRRGAQAGQHLPRRPDRDGRLPDDQARPAQVRGQG